MLIPAFLIPPTPPLSLSSCRALFLSLSFIFVWANCIVVRTAVRRFAGCPATDFPRTCWCKTHHLCRGGLVAPSFDAADMTSWSTWGSPRCSLRNGHRCRSSLRHRRPTTGSDLRRIRRDPGRGRTKHRVLYEKVTVKARATRRTTNSLTRRHSWVPQRAETVTPYLHLSHSLPHPTHWGRKAIFSRRSLGKSTLILWFSGYSVK